ncbi:MAG: FG-GAP-like repeat-containing protein, partial [Anaerolineae bacterium]
TTAALSEDYYRFDPSVNDGQTDLYLPFEILGIEGISVTYVITEPEIITTTMWITRVSMIAVAAADPSTSSGQELDIWATMPPNNPVTDKRLFDYQAYIENRGVITLPNSYFWSGFDMRGMCPNQAGIGGDMDLEMSVTVEPPGVVYSLLGDNLFFLRDAMHGTTPVPDGRDNQIAHIRDLNLGLFDTNYPPVEDGQIISYTVDIRNLTPLTQTVNLLLGTFFALSGYDFYKDGGGGFDNKEPMDIGPGSTGTYVLTATVNVTTTYYNDCIAAYPDFPRACEPYLDVAGLNLGLFVDPYGAAVVHERLWIDHVVDSSAPQFFGIDAPAYETLTRTNAMPQVTFSGYAYDDGPLYGGSGILAVDLMFDKGIIEPIDIAPPTCEPLNLFGDLFGDWECRVDFTPMGPGARLSEGDTFTATLITRDLYNNVRDTGYTLIVDTTPPTTTLWVGETPISDGDVVSVAGTSLVLAGYARDNRSMASGEILICDLTASGECQSAQPLTKAQTYVYDDVPGTPIPLDSSTTCDGSQVTRQFTITDTFTILDLSVGLNITHTFRDDVRATLESPAGTLVTLTFGVGHQASDSQNLDVLLNDAHTQRAQTLGDHDPAAPFYDVELRPYAPLSGFRHEDAAGTWTLTLCDAVPSSDDGAYGRAQLSFVPLIREPQASDWRQRLEFSSLASYFTRTLMVMPLDSAGNEGFSTTFQVAFDNSAAALTATQVVTYISMLAVSAAPTTPVTVLTGIISDDTSVAIFEATLQDPERLIQTEALTIANGSWSYSFLPTFLGTYQIWLTAVDEVGNAVGLGPYSVKVNEPTVSLAVWPDSAPLSLSGTVTYTLSLVNPNPFNTVSAVVTDPLPALVSNPVVISGTATVVGGDTVLWNLGSVAADSSTTTVFTGVVTQSHAHYDAEIVNSLIYSLTTFIGTVTGTTDAFVYVETEEFVFITDTVEITDTVMAPIPAQSEKFAFFGPARRLARSQASSFSSNPRRALAQQDLTDAPMSRAAWGDYDNDGDLDLLLTGTVSDSVSALYRNTSVTSSVRFSRATTLDSSLTDVISSSAAWGDYDNDGDLDILLTGRSSGGDIAHVYENTGSAFVQFTAANLPGISQGGAAWGDYDNDGDLDILLAGSGIAGVYENTGSGFVENTAAGLTGVSRASVAWGDYDNDDDLDILLTGDTGTERVTQLYENIGDGFVQDTGHSRMARNLPGVQYGNVAWGDFDNDGDLDLLLTGCTASAGSCSTGESLARVYQNNAGSFDFYDHLPPGISQGSAAWGDYDNDGDLDILLAGAESGGYVARIFRNTDTGFSHSPAAVWSTPGYGSASWADYDSDGDLDVLLSSASATFYRNARNNANTAPAAPTGLTASVDGAYVTLSWNAASDAETPANGLNYNLAVGTSSGATDIVAPMALSNGTRLLPAIGNAQHNLTATLVITQLDTYYWRVQAIDTAFAGSPWSAETTFDIIPFLDLKVEKAASSIYPNPGGPLTYTLSFANVGTLTATNVTLIDSISKDSGFTVSQIISYGVSITHVAGTTYTWQVADLVPGAGGVITVSGVVSPDLPFGTIIGNTAVIIAADDGYLRNNDDTVDVMVSNPLPNLTIVVTGTGSGTVTPTVGTHTYTEGKVVTMTA